MLISVVRGRGILFVHGGDRPLGLVEKAVAYGGPAIGVGFGIHDLFEDF